MCREGQISPCDDPSHHPEPGVLDGPLEYLEPRRQATPMRLPPRAWPDAGPAVGQSAGLGQAATGARVPAGKISRRAVAAVVPLAAATAATVACSDAAAPASPVAQVAAAPLPQAIADRPAPAPAAPPPPPEPRLTPLGLPGIVQPFWAGDGSRILF